MQVSATRLICRPQTSDVVAVEELRAERDLLKQQLQAAKHDASSGAAELQAALQQMQQHHASTQGVPTATGVAVASSEPQGFQAQVRQLRQQFEQTQQLLKQQEAMLMERGQQHAATGVAFAHAATATGGAAGSTADAAPKQRPATNVCSCSALDAAAGFPPHLLQPDAPMQQLRHAVHESCHGDCGHSCCRGSSARCCSGACTSCAVPNYESSREAALKRSYQGMLQQLQARYQWERHQVELQHKQVGAFAVASSNDVQ